MSEMGVLKFLYEFSDFRSPLTNACLPVRQSLLLSPNRNIPVLHVALELAETVAADTTLMEGQSQNGAAGDANPFDFR